MPTPAVTARVRRAALAGAGVVVATVTVAACGGGSAAAPTSAAAAPTSSDATPASPAPTAPVLATVGDLRIAAGYVPAPASPDVAAAYLTIVNGASTADSLVGASSDVSGSTTMHRTEGGAMIMQSDVPVPGDGTVAFRPGGDHLMLEPLTRTLAKGDRVTLTLRFARAGTVTVTVPVTGYATGGGLPSEALTPLPSTTVAP